MLAVSFVIDLKNFIIIGFSSLENNFITKVGLFINNMLQFIHYLHLLSGQILTIILKKNMILNCLKFIKS